MEITPDQKAEINALRHMIREAMNQSHRQFNFILDQLDRLDPPAPRRAMPKFKSSREMRQYHLGEIKKIERGI